MKNLNLYQISHFLLYSNDEIFKLDFYLNQAIKMIQKEKKF